MPILSCIGPSLDGSTPCPNGEHVVSIRGRTRCHSCAYAAKNTRARLSARLSRGWRSADEGGRACPGVNSPCGAPLAKWARHCQGCVAALAERRRAKRRVGAVAATADTAPDLPADSIEALLAQFRAARRR